MTEYDYKNTPEGRTVAEKYGDILFLQQPELRHPRMTVLNRAKIFSPFAALRGFDEEIREEDQKLLRKEKRTLSEEETGKLSEKLRQVRKGMCLQVRWFVPSPDQPDLGFYCETQGTVTKVDGTAEILELEEKFSGEVYQKHPPVRISFEDLDNLRVLSGALSER